MGHSPAHTGFSAVKNLKCMKQVFIKVEEKNKFQTEIKAFKLQSRRNYNHKTIENGFKVF